MLKTYMTSLQMLNNCSVNDPRVFHSFETLNFPPYSTVTNHGKLCNGTNNVIRIGYKHFVGVAHDHYYRSWEQRVSPADISNDSHENVVAAILEFQNRSLFDESVNFIFLSSVRDILRRRFNCRTQSSADFLYEYRLNYTSLVARIIPMLRQKDTLILQTQHKVVYDKSHIGETEAKLVPLANQEIRKIASFFELPLFDEENLLGFNASKYLSPHDGFHQLQAASDIISLSLSNRCWNISKENKDVCADIQRSWLLPTSNSSFGNATIIPRSKLHGSNVLDAKRNISINVDFAVNTHLFKAFCDGNRATLNEKSNTDVVVKNVEGVLRLPILLVCGHPGPCSDMKWLLEQSLNISENDLDIFGYYLATSLTRLNKSRASIMRSKQLDLKNVVKSISVDEWYSKSSTNRSSFEKVASIYPTIICEFPANECVGLHPVAEKLIIRFSHRWYHHANTKHFKQWIQHHSFQNVILAANNPFDIFHIKMYLGKDAVCIPSLYGNMFQYPYHPTRSHGDWLLLPHHPGGGIPYNSKNSYLSFVRSNLPKDIKLQIATDFLRKKKFDYADLAKFPIGVVFPYASHTSSINEAYSIGIPLFIPRPLLLAEWHLSKSNKLNCGIMSCGMLTHMKIGNNYDFYSNHLYGNSTNYGTTCNIEQNASISCITEWISKADFYNFPYVHLFSTWKSLYHVINNAFHNNHTLLNQSEQSRKWTHQMVSSTAHVLLSNLII